MRLAVIGSRRYPKMEVVKDYMGILGPDTVVITGGWPSRAGGYRVVEATSGVDREAYTAAERHGLVTVIVCGSKTKHGHQAGVQRNPTTISLSDAVVAFWDLKSPGTKRSILLAFQLQKPIRVFGPDGHEVDPRPYLAAG